MKKQIHKGINFDILVNHTQFIMFIFLWKNNYIKETDFDILIDYAQLCVFNRFSMKTDFDILIDYAQLCLFNRFSILNFFSWLNKNFERNVFRFISFFFID